MSRKQRPFTRKQRHAIRLRERQEAAAERRAERDEAKAYNRTLVVFRDVDIERTEALADGRID